MMKIGPKPFCICFSFIFHPFFTLFPLLLPFCRMPYCILFHGVPNCILHSAQGGKLYCHFTRPQVNSEIPICGQLTFSLLGAAVLAAAEVLFSVERCDTTDPHNKNEEADYRYPWLRGPHLGKNLEQC